jgi:hypothetical protein
MFLLLQISKKCFTEICVRWVPCPQVANEGNGLRIWKVSANK